jgi:hypothetical protein
MLADILSSSGVEIFFPAALCADTQFRLTVTIPGPDWVACKASHPTVRWISLTINALA